jgi:hypothetical protein
MFSLTCGTWTKMMMIITMRLLRGYQWEKEGEMKG